MMYKRMLTPSTYADNDDHRDNWMQTFTGRMFFPFRPEDSEVAIEDVAHHLSQINRFTGATGDPYNVAQHSVIVSQLVPEKHGLWGLMHDAEEYVTGDCGSPLKQGLPEFKVVAEKIHHRILDEFGLPHEEPASVKRADLVMVATEARDLMANAPTVWRLPLPPLAGLTVVPWSPKDSERAFLTRFEELTR